jgi:hypothetical protein
MFVWLQVLFCSNVRRGASLYYKFSGLEDKKYSDDNKDVFFIPTGNTISVDVNSHGDDIGFVVPDHGCSYYSHIFRKVCINIYSLNKVHYNISF